MNVIYILWLRQLKRYSRSRARVVSSLAQPLLYLVAMGYGLGTVFQKAGMGSYLNFVAPGLVAMTILFTSVFSGIDLIMDRQFGFLKETLVAPVPRVWIILGRILGGATVSIIQGLLFLGVCLIAGFRWHDFHLLPLAILFMVMTAIVFAALGSVLGCVLSDAQAFPLMMSFLIMPLFFLSGAMYPLANLPGFLTFLTHVDPLSYGVDGLRYALSGTGHFGPLIDLGVLGGCSALLVGLGAYFFSKIQV